MTSLLDQIAPWGRSFDEYCRMFALSSKDFSRPILGCADGPASFNAEMTRTGRRVVSIDPIYQFSAEQIQQRIAAIYDQMISRCSSRMSAFVWDEIRSPQHLGEIRMAAMSTFLDEYERGRESGRYVCAGLPELPFADGQFSLALCSHYLFTYSEALCTEHHLAAIVEMLRVASEVRVFPLLDMFGGGRSPHVVPVIRELTQLGYETSVRRASYEFQRGGNEMLVAARR